MLLIICRLYLFYRNDLKYLKGMFVMTKDQAVSAADIFGGQVWQSGGGIWLVIIHRADGSKIIISDESVVEFATEDEFESGSERNRIILCA